LHSDTISSSDLGSFIRVGSTQSMFKKLQMQGASEEQNERTPQIR
jgi:hypothetical protein